MNNDILNGFTYNSTEKFFHKIIWSKAERTEINIVPNKASVGCTIDVLWLGGPKCTIPKYEETALEVSLTKKDIESRIEGLLACVERYVQLNQDSIYDRNCKAIKNILDIA